MVQEFTPFIVEIIKNYHYSTKGEKVIDKAVVDSSILQHVLDILC